MIFKRILINNFGGLWEKDIELTSGVNVLYGLKETEMNIVFIFVKSMFFGVPEEMQEKNGIYEKAGTEASREKYGGTIWFHACYDNGLSVRFMFKYLPFHLFPVCQQGKTETFRKGETFPAGNGQPNKPFQCVAVKENTIIGHTGVR